MKVRRLTPGEQTLARAVFGGALRLEHVRLLGLGWPVSRVFVPGRLAGRAWIVWPRDALQEDFADASLDAQATLIHELVHVWQAQQGVLLPFAKLKAGDGEAAYRYDIGGGWDWANLNIEQQAMVVEHAFRLSRGGWAPCDAAFYGVHCPFVRREGGSPT